MTDIPRPPHALLFTGHRVDDPGRPTPRFPPEKVDVARKEIGAAIEDAIARHGSPLVGISGAASGGDILFQEECHARGIATTIYLALPKAEYAAQSVDSAGPEWTRRYNALLESTPSRVLPSSEGLPLGKDADSTVWQRSNLWMLHDALTNGSERVTLIALWDGKAGDGDGGTEHMVEQIRERGGEVIRIGLGTVFPANRNCDIVMKGGITSGVVYPLAITELAEEFRFRNIGGTSAGAIAAALTAAAEYSRLEKTGEGFERLKKLPEFLAGRTAGEPNLLNLFPPTRSTRRLFAVLESFLGGQTTGQKVSAAFSSLLGVSPLLTIASLIPALVLLLVIREQFVSGVLTRPVVAAFVVLELALILLAAILIVLGNAVRALTATLPRNRFGFSTGRAPEDRPLPGVSDWLHAEIQATAGRTLADPPLTFGDLWLAGMAAPDRTELLKQCERDPESRSINLQMVTTALTHGHPYRLPFENRRFAFRPSELRDYFPDDVVAAMVSRARADDDVAGINDPDLVALPEPWDLPIIVAARMSLSFPLLFCMVPLYTVDYTLKVNQERATRFDRCWFIDGGLSSNFPINLFDSPLPRWPTFGINLDGFHPDYPKQEREEENVWIPQTAGGGTSDHWLHIPDSGGAAIGGYIRAILDAIRNWRDNTQMAVPGFRDRIVHVKLSPEEGGLNLNMDAAKVSSLSARGMWAGRRLCERFGALGARLPSGPGWNTHRWTRYRCAMMLLQELMRGVESAYDYSDPLYPTYRDLVARMKNENPKTSYWWSRAPEPYQAHTDLLIAFARKFSATPPDFDDRGAPSPRPEIRISPRL
jgi:predicted acylesterase/phospholipase RssA